MIPQLGEKSKALDDMSHPHGCQKMHKNDKNMEMSANSAYKVISDKTPGPVCTLHRWNLAINWTWQFYRLNRSCDSGWTVFQPYFSPTSCVCVCVCFKIVWSWCDYDMIKYDAPWWCLFVRSMEIASIKNDPRIDRAFAHIKGDGTYFKSGSKTDRTDPETVISNKFANITGHSESSLSQRGQFRHREWHRGIGPFLSPPSSELYSA